MCLSLNPLHHLKFSNSLPTEVRQEFGTLVTPTKADIAKAYGLAASLAVIICFGFCRLFAGFYVAMTANPNTLPSELTYSPESLNMGYLLSVPFAAIAAWQAIFAVKGKYSQAFGPGWVRRAADNIAVRVVIFLGLMFGVKSQLMDPISTYLQPMAGEWPGEFLDAIATIGAFFVVSKLFHRKSLSSWGLALKGMPKDVIVGFIFGAIMMSMIAGGLVITNVYHVVRVEWTSQIFSALAFYSMAAFVEELIFRGYIFQSIETRYGTTIGLAMTALLFGFAHMLNFIPGAPPWMKLYGCTCLVFEAGILLNAAFIVRRALWFATGMHWAWNVFEGPVYGMDVSGSESGPSIVTANLKGSVFATGGQFGPEASLSGVLIGTIFGIVMIWLCVKRGLWLSGQQARELEAQRVAQVEMEATSDAGRGSSGGGGRASGDGTSSGPPTGVGYDI